jgi:hypothetical protein
MGWYSGRVSGIGSPRTRVAVPVDRKAVSTMRHIPKLAAVVGAVTIGLLGFQGVASADPHPGNGYDPGHHVFFFPPPPPRHHGGDGDGDGDDHGHGYPGTTSTTSTTTTTTTQPVRHHHHHPFPIVFHPGDGGRGFRLLSTGHNKGHK